MTVKEKLPLDKLTDKEYRKYLNKAAYLIDNGYILDDLTLLQLANVIYMKEKK